VVNDSKLTALFDCKSEAMANVKSQKAVERRQMNSYLLFLRNGNGPFPFSFAESLVFPTGADIRRTGGSSNADNGGGGGGGEDGLSYSSLTARPNWENCEE